MVFTVAVVPSLALLIYIYKMDKKEKEPTGFLFRLFMFGVMITFIAVGMENVIEAVVDAVATSGSVMYAILDGFVVAAFSEELCKYVILRKITWKSPHFNCMFDGIVYSVFISLGFATFENMLYVLDGGLATALYRMFTAVPGHMCFAVYMGYYYSMSRLAYQSGNMKAYRKCKKKTLWIPILLHGIYDSLIMVEEDIVGEDVLSLFMLAWIVFVIIMFVRTFKFVKLASMSDVYITCVGDDLELSATQYLKKAVRNIPIPWKCSCSKICYGNFCERCGKPRNSR